MVIEIYIYQSIIIIILLFLLVNYFVNLKNLYILIVINIKLISNYKLK